MSAHAEVHGELPVLRPELRARVGAGEVFASAVVTLPETPRAGVTASATVRATDLDVSALQEGAPASKLAAILDATVVSRPGGKVSGTWHLENEVGELRRQVVPAVSAEGEFTESSVRGTARIADRGAPARVRFSLQPRPGGASPDQLALQVDATAPDLAAIPRAGRIGHGRAHLVAEGRADLHDKTFLASASVELAGVDVKGVHLARGVVTASGEGTLASPRVVVDARGEDVRAGGYAFPQVNATARGTPQALDVQADVRGGIEGGAVHVGATLRGRHLEAEVRASLGTAGRIDLSAVDVTLGGAVTEPRAWKAATGSVTLDGHGDLQQLLAQIPVRSRPVAAAAGLVALKGYVSRPSPAASPEVAFEASTKGLAVAAKQARTEGPDWRATLGPRPFTLAGLDGSFAVKLAATTGRAEVSAQVHDERGPLVSLDAAATLPLRAIAASPARLLALVGDTPLQATIVVPRRSLDALPPALGKPPVTGEVELAADLAGSARVPRLTLTAKATHLLARGADACVRPLDVEAKVDYDGTKAIVRVVGSRDGGEIARAGADVKVSAAQALTGGPLAWSASGDVALARFPLDAVAPLVERPVSGEVSGNIALADLHRAAGVDADLEVHALSLDRTTFPTGKVGLHLRDGALTASARLDQADGFLETRATGGVTWGAAVTPRLDLARPVDVSIEAQGFRANAAMPFVQGIFSELDGRIDADARIHVVAGGKDGSMTGAVTLRDGSFEVPQLGERFHGLRGRVVMSPWGTLQLQDFAADATSGHLTASGSAVLRGLALKSAAAQVHVARGQSIPVSVEGVPMGRAHGEVKATARMSPDGRRLDVAVDVPVLRVDLPQSIGRQRPAAGADPAVRVGVPRGRRRLRVHPAGPPRGAAPRRISSSTPSVALGKDVEVRRDTTVAVVVHGRLDVVVSDEAHVTGTIEVERGEARASKAGSSSSTHGTVTFLPNGCVQSSMVVATAPAQERSGRGARLRRLLGARRLGQAAPPLRAGPVAGRDPLPRALRLPRRELRHAAPRTAGVDRRARRRNGRSHRHAGPEQGHLRDHLRRRLHPRRHVERRQSPPRAGRADHPGQISARLGYKLGVPAPGENPDRTELTLDWRFIRNWSLVAVVGDQGSTALDVLWRMRY